MINYQTPGLVTKPSENILNLSCYLCKNNFQLNRRKEFMPLTEECTKVTGIPHVMDAYREEAEAILSG